MGLTKDDNMTVDHIDGNPLNNKRNNLRIAYHSQNMANQKKRKGCKCFYKGVCEARSKYTDVVKYEASITLNYKTYHLGLYKTQEEAGLVYDKAALALFNDFARLNFPDRIKEHKKIRVRYVDYDQDKVIHYTNEDLKAKAEKLIEKKIRNKENRANDRLEQYKSYIRKVKNKELGRVLRVTVHGHDEIDRFYTDIDKYDDICQYKYRVYGNRIIGHYYKDSGKMLSLTTILGLESKSGYVYKSIDKNPTNYTIANFSKRKSIVKPTPTKDYVENIVDLAKNGSSKYIGVRATSDSGYRVTGSIKGKSINLGTYPNEKFAAKVYDVFARRMNRPEEMINFPDYHNEYIKLPQDPDYVKPPKLMIKDNRTSLYVGVVQDKNRYIANLGKIRLGRYSDESKAGTAVAYGAIKTGLYKIDDRWLNFDRDEVKEKIKKYLTREEREQIRENLNGLKWA